MGLDPSFFVGEEIDDAEGVIKGSEFGIPRGSKFLKYIQNYFTVSFQNFHVYSIHNPEFLGVVGELIVVLTFWVFVTLAVNVCCALPSRFTSSS
jgi:hypothetical protein